MADINSTAINLTIPIVGKAINTIQNLFGVLQWLLGGLFGLYLVFLTMKWYEIRKMRIMAESMKVDIQSLRTSVERIEEKIDKSSRKPRTRNKKVSKNKRSKK